MQLTTINKIRDMGYDKDVSVEEIDTFVDECLAFLRRVQDTDSEMNLNGEIFELEDARQKALLNKYCLTVQPTKF